MLMKEYRICMPLSVAEYQVGQLYMISKHSHEQSNRGEGVEVIKNEHHDDPEHGEGQYTEKRLHLSSKLPNWAKAVVPRLFYITEKAWNFYPLTITEYTCSFLPKFSIYIKTKYEDNNGSNNNTFLNEANSAEKEVCFLDIALDEISERYYKEAEDLRNFVSTKTGRGPLCEGWQNDSSPIMCSYKLVTVKFDVWGLQGRVEQFVHKICQLPIHHPHKVMRQKNVLHVRNKIARRAIRDVLLIGHRQAFAWVDEWYGMSMEEVRHFESTTQEATNKKLGIVPPVICICEPPALSVTHSAPPSTPSTPVSLDPPEFLSLPKDRPRKSSAPEMLFLPSNKH